MEGRTKWAWLWVLLGLSLGLTAFSNYWKSNLRVKEIIVEGNRIVEKNEIMQISQVKNGTLLYEVDLTGVQRNVLSHLYVKEASVERNIPSSIKISVVERQPLTLVNANEIRYLDEDGVVLPHSISKAVFDLPVLSGIPEDASLKLGSRVEHVDVQEALAVLWSAKFLSKELYHMISEVQIRQGDIVLYSADGGIPIIFGRDEIPNKLARLETFWNEVVKDQGVQNLQYIDVRYADQIVVRWKPEHQALKSL